MTGGRLWTDEEDEQLAALVTDGLDYRLIARRLDRSVMACRVRASARGLKKDRDVVLRNRKIGRERFIRSEARVERWKKKLRASFNTQAREILSAEARERNLAGTFGVRQHSAETRRKISDALKGKPFSENHKQKISEAKRRYWALRRFGGVDLDAYRQTLMADKKHRASSGEQEPVTVWCDQPNVAGCRMPSDVAIAAADRLRRRDAELGSSALLKAIHAYLEGRR